MKKEITIKYFKKSLTVTQGLITIVMFTLLPLVVFTLFSSKVDNFSGFRSFVVLTGSMYPLIPTGSIIYSQKTLDYKVGDVITFEKGGVTVTHRIVDILDKEGKRVSYLMSPLGGNVTPNEVFFRTQGDANNVADSELVSESQVVGEALFHFPYLGFLVMFLKSMQGFLLAVILPTFIFIGFELFKIKKEIEKNMEKKFLEKMRRFEMSSN